MPAPGRRMTRSAYVVSVFIILFHVIYGRFWNVSIKIAELDPTLAIEACWVIFTSIYIDVASPLTILRGFYAQSLYVTFSRPASLMRNSLPSVQLTCIILKRAA